MILCLNFPKLRMPNTITIFNQSGSTVESLTFYVANNDESYICNLSVDNNAQTSSYVWYNSECFVEATCTNGGINGVNFYGIFNYACTNALCTDQSSCTGQEPCCGGVPNPLATKTSDYETTSYCESGFLYIFYYSNSNTDISGFSYISCNDSSNDINITTNYNLPQGVTATTFSISDSNKTLKMKIIGNDSNTYYLLFSGGDYGTS